MAHALRLFRSLCVLAMAALVAGPALAQQVVQPAAPMTPQPVLSEEATALLAGAATGTMPAELQVTSRAFMFPSASGGGTLMMMAFQLQKSEIAYETSAPAADGTVRERARIEVFGSIMQDGAEVRRVGTMGGLPAQAGDAMSTGTFSFGETLPAGTYDIVWGVRDAGSGAATVQQTQVEVPDLTGGLSFSSIMMTGQSPVSAPEPFQPNTIYYGIKVFTVAFLDELTHEFGRDDAVMLVYLVNGAQPDSSTNAPEIELRYEILDADGESIWKAEPQTQNRPTVGQQIPFGSIEELEANSDYHFKITAKDKVADEEAVVEVPFRISG